ncbi:MAG: hypothetical protein M3P37_12450 [Actinomycetota bacterium]|nr:hypothetical protein [Actinomycetota bacterium]
MSDGFVQRGHDEGPGSEVASPGRASRRVLPALLAGLLVLLLLSAMAVPLLLDRSSTDSDDQAKGLLLGASSEMEACAASAGGSFEGCGARRMRELSPGIEWREGVAPYGLGWGDGRVGRIYVSVTPGGGNANSYRLETTSGSGYVFSYGYSGGSVTKVAKGSSEPEPW